jgi:diguanylate cyclase (GGDEF)-like protein
MYRTSTYTRGFAPPGSWALWQARRRVVALVLAVDLAALLLTVSALAGTPNTASDLLRFGLLAATSVAYLELTRQVEHRRRLFVAANASHTDVTSVWTFAAVIVLPSGLAALVAGLTYAHLWLRSWRLVDDARPHRVAYSAASVALTCLAVSTIIHALGSAPGGRADAPGVVVVLAVGLVAYQLVNRSLILAALTLTGRRPRPSTLLTDSWTAAALEFATLVLGAATAVLVVRVPPLAVLVLPAVFLLQHRALLKQLVEAATMDVKTELLNAAAWRQLAQRELERAAQTATATAVLVIDMDHFKRINDTYGHLAGDQALKTVGEALADELRGYDAVGRFGGEEFAALLPGVEPSAAGGVAERVRARIGAVRLRVERHAGGMATVGVTASVGVAVTLGGVDLDGLLRAADAAVYAAKAAGRNVVRQAPVATAV